MSLGPAHPFSLKAASVAVLTGLALCLIPAASAQINGAPTSVTSTGFGGRAINGTPTSVTSTGFGGRSINGTRSSVTATGHQGYTPGASPAGSKPVHHPHNRSYGGVWGVPYYPYDPGYAEGADGSADYAGDQYNGGPTIFDSRGPGSMLPPAPYQRNAPPSSAYSANAGNNEPASPQPETILVFKDGHELEVENYAIIGQTLYDLTGDTRHKIALADLDLAATQRENNSHGTDFSLPAAPAAN